MSGLDPRVTELAAAFAKEGRELRVDRITRQLFATDASPYKIMPAAVFRAREPDEIALAVQLCAAHEVPVVARGAGTSLSGQCVGEGVQIDCSALDQIEWVDAYRGIARVQPGVTWWRLDAAARAQGLEFGPDPATRRVCTIGGMIGSNSGGTHSITAGATVDHVRAVEVVLADGTRARFEASSDGSVASAGAASGLAGQLEQIRHALNGHLGDQFSTLARRGSGYQLEHLCEQNPDLGKLMAGSDGTLGLITAAEISLDPRPPVRVLAMLGFADMHAALSVVPTIVETGPSAVELVSGSMLEVARADPVHAPATADVDPSLGSLLFVEYAGDSEAEAVAGFGRMDRAVRERAHSNERYTDPAACARKWAIREAGVGALSSVAGGPLLPQAFVEDTTVAVDRLPAYIKEFEKIFDAHGMRAVWYGHASTGLIHVRPFVDMTSAKDLETLEGLMRDSVDLVRAYGGDLCGEHGNGISRTYWNERLFGKDIYEQLRAIKTAFDPRNLLNPGKVVDGPHPLEQLRYGASYVRGPVDVSIGFDDQGGFAAATERCFGAGVCRKRDTGTMCPPAAASGLEEHSTRARANLLRAVVSGDLAPTDLSEPQAREVMETCVGCKACKTECPARVDMARLKIAWSDLARRRDGATPLARALSNLRTLAAMGSIAPVLANRVLGSRAFKQRLGVAKQRMLPSLAGTPLTRRVRAGAAKAVLYPDCFTTYFEPDVGVASVELAAAARETLARARAGCCGRVMLSEGFVDKGRATARRSARALRRTKGPILFCEPSCMSAVTDDWPHLIGDVSDIAARCMLAEEHIADIGAKLKFESGGRALLHGHCHQKALWGTGVTEKALALVPDLELTTLDAGCCGMAGGFGYREERQELSRAMAERVLLPAVRADPDAVVIATGTSCRHQVADLGDRKAVHPLVFLRERLR